MLLLWWNPFNLNTITNTNQDAVPSRPAAQRAPIHTIAIGSMIPSNSVLRALEETKTTLKSVSRSCISKSVVKSKAVEEELSSDVPEWVPLAATAITETVIREQFIDSIDEYWRMRILEESDADSPLSSLMSSELVVELNVSIGAESHILSADENMVASSQTYFLLEKMRRTSTLGAAR
jgi:hypothetical protein